jgi:hypothetical protein
MDTQPEVAIEVSLRPQDVYQPFLCSWRNLARWVLSLFVAYLTYDTRAIWTSALANPNQGPGVLALLLAGGALFLAWLVYPYFRVRSMFRSSPILLTSRRIWFNAEGIRIESEDGRGDYKWSILLRID